MDGNVKAKYIDRLFLFLPQHLGKPYRGSRGEIIVPQDPKDITIADGFPDAVLYMQKKNFLDGSTKRPSFLERIGNLSAKDVTLVVKDFEPEYKGMASIVFANVTEESSVVNVHASSPMYEIDI